MMFSLTTQAASSFLAFKVAEYATAAYKADNNVTKLSVIAFKLADGMSAANCTFNWSTTEIGSADTSSTAEGSGSLNAGLTYVSGCHASVAGTDLYYNSSATGTKYATTTASFTQFLAFDAVNIYYNNTLYYSINATNAAAVGFTPSTFFAGTSGTPYTWAATGAVSTFAAVTGILTGNDCFSTVTAKLYIAKFQGDYSYLTGTVEAVSDNSVACKLYFTSLNEAVCKLGIATGATALAGTSYNLILKNAAGNIMFKQPFARYFTTLDKSTPANTKTTVNQTVERQIIQYTLPPAPPATDSKSNPILTTSFVINLKDNSTKSAVDMTDNSCPVVNVLIQSNGSTVVNGSNVSPDPSKGLCYITVSSNTNALVPWTDFVMNATYSNGTTYISTKAKLTPRMISDWAANSLNGTAIVVALSDINKSGLTGGEVAAIVIGSCAGALLVALLAGIFIRWCAYGCMYPAAVAAPKMMM